MRSTSVLLVIVACGLSVRALAGDTTTRVSVDSSGAQANKASDSPSLSGDGRYVTFRSAASNLVAGDTNNTYDIFLHDRATGETKRINLDWLGRESGGNHNVFLGTAMSADGRYAAFATDAQLLPQGNGWPDTFVYELATGTIKDASVSSSGVPGNLWSNGGKSLSADGRYAAFGSKASNLVNGDTNDSWDVFVHDFVTAETTRVSVNSSGAQRVDDSTNPSISGDGRYVAFETWAHFDPNDTLYWDIYVHDRQTGETTLVSVDSSGNYGNFHSTNAAISADGRYVAFESLASNLVPGDTNGVSDVFVHDRVTATTTRVSVDTSGNQLGRPSHNPSISQDGRYIAWNTLNISNVYVRDQVTGQVVIASVSDSGDVRGGINPHLTPDAKFIAFESVAKLVPEDTNTYDDIYLRGRELTLEAEPVVVSPGSTLTLSTYHGTSGNAASLWAVQLDSNPLFRLIAVGSFASDGGWVLSGTVPSGWATGDLTFRGYCIGLHGFVTTTNDVTVTFQ